MVFIGIKLHLELSVGLYQRINKLHTVLHMNIVVGKTMNDKQFAF
ncbi:MAG: hypothetical protein BWY70_02012 [Bacteroidetes bacterium ADurb.Bin408]|nr:MAG: hypothetical protein BWY70_02012 [Bacteroidetes bacterium ADurb.Bin408]